MRDDELDRLIDAGLSAYAESRAGIEGRVLAAIAAEREPAARRPAWRMWALALSAAACVLFAVLVGVRIAKTPQMVREHAINSAHAPTVNRAAAPDVRKAAPMRASMQRHVRARRVPQIQRLPKQDVFPTPRPLSPELQAFAEYVAKAPEKERQQLVQDQAQINAPLEIPALHIPPIDSSSNDGN